MRTIALPAASYPEMMLWSLPALEQARIEAEQHWLEGQGKPELARRIATGNWREFLARYPESRWLHRRVSELSARIEGLSRSCSARDQYDEARREVHRAQCNCSYWHGVFGGFYLPHLRESVRGHMLRADALADALQGSTGGWVLEEGEEDLRLKSRRVVVGVERLSGAIVEIAERRRPFDFACVIGRRREVYHARVEEAARRASHEAGAGSAGGVGLPAKPETIHGAISMKEPGLERLLEYDERPRVASQEWILSARELAAAGGRLSAAIGRGPAGVRFRATASSAAAPPFITLSPSGGPFPGIRKEITAGPDEGEFEVAFTGLPAEHWLVTEWNLSLLTPDAPGRRLLIGGAVPRGVAPGSTGEAASATSIRLEDSEYLRVALTLEFQPAARVEWFPIETVSLSEAGAERVYQGTAFVIGFSSAASAAPIRIHARIEGAAGAL